MRGHLKHMAIGSGAILVVLLVLGVDLAALPWALLLACPLMMVGMMFTMSRNHGAGAVGQASEEADVTPGRPVRCPTLGGTFTSDRPQMRDGVARAFLSGDPASAWA